LSDQAIQVLVVWQLDSEIALANVVDGLVVNHETAVRVLQGGVGRQDRVVRLDDRGGHLGSRVDAELEFALLAIVDRETLHQQGTKARPSTAAERMEDQEALKTAAVVGDSPDLVQHLVDEFLANCVVSTGIVVGSVLFSCDHLLGMEQGAIRAGAHFVDHIGLEIAVDGARNIFAVA
jgi:hypothetical protein